MNEGLKETEMLKEGNNRSRVSQDKTLIPRMNEASNSYDIYY